MEAADGVKCGIPSVCSPSASSPALFPGLREKLRQQEKTALSGWGCGDRSEHGIHSKQESELCLGCVCLAKNTQSLKSGKAHWGRKGREKRPGRLNLYENPTGLVGDC